MHTVYILKIDVFFIAAKEGAGAVDEEDFIKAFDDVPVVQVSESEGWAYSSDFIFKHVTRRVSY